MGLSLILISQYPIHIIAQHGGTDFTEEPAGPVAANQTSLDLAGNATILENSTAASSDSVVESLGRPESLASDFREFELNTGKIAIELTMLTPVEIRQYPITDLSVNDIKAALSLLNPHALARVLLYIPGEDLLKVKDMLSPITFNQTINRLSVENRTQVEDRLSNASAIP